MLVTQRARNLPVLFIFVTLICGGILLSGFIVFSDISLVPQANITRLPYARGEKVLLLFWSKLWRRPAKMPEGFLEKSFEKGRCPVACEVTADKNRIKNAHAFIVHARDPHSLPPNKDIRWILTSLKNPAHTPVLRNPEYMSQFHLLRSYRLDSDFPTPLFKKPNFRPSRFIFE